MTKTKHKTLAQQLADPNIRAKLPASKLTPGQRAERQRLARVKTDDANPLLNPASQLTGHDLAVAVRRLADMELKPKLGALDRQAETTRTQNTALMDRAKGYFGDLAGRDNTAVDAARTSGTALTSGLAGIADTTRGRVQQAQTSEQAGVQADLQRRGSELGGGASEAIRKELAAQEARNAGNAQAFQSTGQLQATGAEQFAREAGQVNQARGGETQQQLINRVASALADIGGKRADVESTRGDLETKNLLGLRQSGFENLATARGLNIKTKELAQDAQDLSARIRDQTMRRSEARRHNRAGESAEDRRADLAERKFSSQEEKDAYQRLHKLGGYKPAAGSKETAASRTVNRQIGNALDSYSNYLGQGHSLGWIAKQAQKSGVPNDVANAAADIAQFGYVTPEHQRQLERAGVAVPAEWRRRGGQAFNGPR